MGRWNTLHSFYTSKEWNCLKERLMLERTNESGELVCEYCGMPIWKTYNCIPHHIKELTLDNVNDFDISLNPENIMLVCFSDHNKLHDRFNGGYTKRVYLVHGSPLAGKSSFVIENANHDDLIVDIDRVWKCISNEPNGEKPKRLRRVTFSVFECLLDNVRLRVGDWRNAWIVGSYPLKAERERMLDLYGAEAIHIDTGRGECLSRCVERPKEWLGYVDTYWERFQP